MSNGTSMLTTHCAGATTSCDVSSRTIRTSKAENTFTSCPSDLSIASAASIGQSGTRDEVGGGDDGEDGEGNARATKVRRGTRAGKKRAGNQGAAAWRARG